jgi:hypothetical protein
MHACIDVAVGGELELSVSRKLGFHAESAPGDVLRRKEIELEGSAASSLMASFLGFSPSISSSRHLG